MPTTYEELEHLRKRVDRLEDELDVALGLIREEFVEERFEQASELPKSDEGRERARTSAERHREDGDPLLEAAKRIRERRSRGDEEVGSE